MNINGEDVLWLPPEHRLEHVDVHENMIAYFDQSERAQVMEFDFEKLPRPPARQSP